MDKSISDEIVKLREQAHGLRAQADKLEKLASEFPDIKRTTGRWDKVAYYTKSANMLVSKYDIRHNCGCCSASPVEVWPYMMSATGERVYSDPPKFIVGEGSYWSGDVPYPGWEDQMREAGIGQRVIAAVRAHFAQAEEERKNDRGEEDVE